MGRAREALHIAAVTSRRFAGLVPLVVIAAAALVGFAGFELLSTEDEAAGEEQVIATGTTGILPPPRVVSISELPPPEKTQGDGEAIPLPNRVPLSELTAGAGAQPAANAPGPAGVVSEGAVVPGIGTTLEGLSNDFNDSLLAVTFEPPDPQIAVSTSHIVEMTNTVGMFRAKAGGVPTVFSLDAFFGVSPSGRGFDPKVIYDNDSQRFFAVYVSLVDRHFLSNLAGVPDEGVLHIAVSATEDPNDNWSVYSHRLSHVFPDYPGLGLTDDKVTISSNQFDIDRWFLQGSCRASDLYCGADIVVYEKSDLVAGGMAAFSQIAPDIERFTIRPVHSLSSIGDQYLAENAFLETDQLDILRITGTPRSGNVALSVAASLTIAEQLGPPPSRTTGSVFGLPASIDSGDRRLLEAIWRDNRLWTASSARCLPPQDTTTRSCAHLVEVDTSGAPSIVQDIMYGRQTEFISWPAIRTDAHGNLFAVVTRTSALTHAETGIIARFANDPLNTLSSYRQLRVGEVLHGSCLLGGCRWGDYQGAAVDPSGECVWVVGQYARDTVGDNWATYIGATSYTGGCGAPVIPTPVPTPVPTPTPLQGACVDDAFEHNDQLQSGWDIGLPFSEQNLVACPAENDYFDFYLDAGAEVHVDVLFSHASGNIETQLHDPFDAVVAATFSTDDNETFTYTAASSGAHTLLITRPLAGDPTGTPYKMIINVTCGDDAQEDNDSPAAATAIALDASLSALRLCPGDDDYFSFHLDEGQQIDVQATFVHADGDVDISILDAAGTPVAVAPQTGADDEHISHVATATGLHIVRATLFAGRPQFGTDYTLDVLKSVPTPTPTPPSIEMPCDDDAFEDNDTQETAMGVSPQQAVPALRACPFDEDWYSFPLTASQQVQIDASFSHDGGNVNIALFDPDGDFLVASNSETDGEQIIRTAESTGTFTLRAVLFGNDPQDGANYALAISTQGGPPPPSTPSPTPTTGAPPTGLPTQTPTETPAAGLLGDADCSGFVNAIDAAFILQMVAALIGNVPCPENADANLNGTINTVDAALILQLVAGLISELPPDGGTGGSQRPGAAELAAYEYVAQTVAKLFEAMADQQ